jgi:uncharacterized protein YhdP
MRVTSSEVMGNLRVGDNTMEGARRVSVRVRAAGDLVRDTK